MTDTKESNYQDVADLRAENSKLRAEVDFANERMHAAKQERDKLRVEAAHNTLAWQRLADVTKECGRPPDHDLHGWLRAAASELAALRQQADAAAPSDAEIEAATQSIVDKVRAWGRAHGDLDAARKHYAPEQVDMIAVRDAEDVCEKRYGELFDAVGALMRRAQRPAPAASGALREAVRWSLDRLFETKRLWFNAELRVKGLEGVIATVMERLDAALAAEAPAPSSLREAAKRARERYREWERIPGAGVRDDISRDNFIEAARKLMEACEALTAEPPAPSAAAAAGVAVPEGVRMAATRINAECHYARDLHLCADFILSLPTAAGASQPEPAAQQQPQAAEPRETRCWPLIKLNTLCVQRLAQWGFTNANPFREEDERQVIDACREKREATCPHPGIRDASTPAAPQQPQAAEPDAELQRLLSEMNRPLDYYTPNHDILEALREVVARLVRKVGLS